VPGGPGDREVLGARQQVPAAHIGWSCTRSARVKFSNAYAGFIPARGVVAAHTATWNVRAIDAALVEVPSRQSAQNRDRVSGNREGRAGSSCSTCSRPPRMINDRGDGHLALTMSTWGPLIIWHGGRASHRRRSATGSWFQAWAQRPETRHSLPHAG
jgi:hypothetical protein